jgi:tetratricopeptide (TPR) repeat protein
MLQRPGDMNGLLDQLEEKSRQNPADLDLLQRLSRLYMRNGNNTDAEAVIEKILKIDPDNAQVMVELADCQIRRGAYEDATYNIERALELRPGMTSAFITMARLYEAQGNVEKQVSFMMRAANAAPDKSEIRLSLAETLKRYGDISGAMAQYKLILETSPDLEAALFSLGTLQLRQNDAAAAAGCFRKIIAGNPSAFDAHFNLASCYFRQRKYRMAAGHFRVSQRQPDLAQRSMYLMAQCHFKQHEYDHAIVSLEKLLELDENNVSYLKSLAEAYEAAEEPDMARDVYRRLVAVAPERPEFIVRMASLMIELGEHERAEKALDQLFRLHPGHVEGHRILGDLYAGRGDYRSAIEEYRRTLMINENNLKVFSGLAKVYKALGNDEEEQQALKRAVDLGCESPEALLRLGQLERKLRLPDSLDRFRRIAELVPDSNFAREAEYFIRHKAA